MSFDPRTLDFYDTNAADYARFAAPEGPYPRLERFLSLMPEGARVLDLGCGTAWAAAAMRDAGLQADAMDASEGLAEQARALYGIEVRRGRFRTLSVRQRYHGIWCHFALQHAERTDRPQIFERLHTALKPGGLLYLSAQKGPVEWRDAHDRLYCPFREEDLRDLLAGAGFDEPEFETDSGKMYDGTSTLNIYAWARSHA